MEHPFDTLRAAVDLAHALNIYVFVDYRKERGTYVWFTGSEHTPFTRYIVSPKGKVTDRFGHEVLLGPEP
jgi:hypothetical protein